MIGVRTALVVVLLGGLALIGGRSYSADAGPDSGWVRRLQILVGRPAPMASTPSAVVTSDPVREVKVAIPSNPTDAREVAPRVAAGLRDRAPARPAPPSPPAPASEAMEAFRAGGRTVEGANLRASPRIDGPRIDVIGRGQQLEMTGRSTDGRWYRVQHLDRDAFVSAGLVSAEWVDTPAGRVKMDDVRDRLEEMSTSLRRARFREVVDAASPVREQLGAASRWVDVDASIVRLELLTATAQIALERDVEAFSSLERALAVDQSLELDPVRSPPKLVRLLAEVRTTR